MRLPFSLLAVVVGFTSLCAAPAADKLSGMEALLEAIRAQHTLPALAAAVVRGTNIVAVGAVGVRKLGSPEQVTVADKFHIGSCTKSMTATLAALMVEDGTIRWTDSPGTVLTNLAAGMEPRYRDVPLDLLLRHRGGVPGDLNKDGLWGKVWSRAAEPPLDQRRSLIRELTQQAPAHELGSKFEYSNAGYALAGHMLETAAGRPWEELLRERLFKPLGMTSAGFGPPASDGQVDQPWGHTPGTPPKSDRPVPPGLKADNPAAIGPGGTVHCSIGDLARYAAFHLQGARSHGSLLKPVSFHHLHTPLKGQDYACGWTVTQRGWGEGEVLTHNGSNTMFFAVIWLAPKKDFAVVVATNLGGPRAEKGTDAAAWQLIQTYLVNPAKPAP